MPSATSAAAATSRICTASKPPSAASAKRRVEHPAPARGLAAGERALGFGAVTAIEHVIAGIENRFRFRGRKRPGARRSAAWTRRPRTRRQAVHRRAADRGAPSVRVERRAGRDRSPGLAFVDAFANSAACRHRRRPRGRRHQRRLPRRAVHETVRALVADRGSTPRSSRTATSTTSSASTSTRRRRATNGWAPPRVVAHEAIADRFDRYAMTAGYNGVINQRQFQAPGLRWPTEYRYPDETYRDALDARRRRRDVRAAPRPRRDRRPHLGVGAGRARSCARATCSSGRRRTAATRRRCSATRATGPPAFRKMAALGAEVLLPGHGLPIVGADRVAPGAHRRRRAARVAARRRRSR